MRTLQDRLMRQCYRQQQAERRAKKVARNVGRAAADMITKLRRHVPLPPAITDELQELIRLRAEVDDRDLQHLADMLRAHAWDLTRLAERVDVPAEMIDVGKAAKVEKRRRARERVTA